MASLKFIIVLLIVILSIHFFAIIYSWYWMVGWLDMLMHFLGGFWVAAVFVNLSSRFKIQSSKFLFDLVLTLSFIALIGVLWEFSEFLYDFFISASGYSKFIQQGAGDTMSDLFFDLLGGLIFLVIYKFCLNRKSSLKRTRIEE